MNPWWRTPSPDGSSPKKKQTKHPKEGDESAADFLGSPDYFEDAELDGDEIFRSALHGEGSSGTESTEGSGSRRNRPGRRRRRPGGRGGRRRRSSSRRNTKLTAVLCELDSLAKTLADTEIETDHAVERIDRLLALREGAVKRFYHSGNRHSALGKALEGAGYERVTVEGGGSSVKVRLALEALELHLAGNSQGGKEATSFVLLAHDKALVPLAGRLREGGAEVIVIADPELPLAKAASRAIALDAPIDESAEEAPENRSEPLGDEVEATSKRRSAGSGSKEQQPDEALEAERASGYGEQLSAENLPPGDLEAKGDEWTDGDTDQLLAEAIATLATAPRRLVWGTSVLQAMQEMDPRFNEQRAGFDSFEEILEDAERRGLLRCRRSQRSDTYLITEYRRPASA